MSKALKGRGAASTPPGRFETLTSAAEPDGWYQDEAPDSVATTVTAEAARSIISRNDSPDLPFDQSINPYRGCEHGCIYCYARPSHAYLGLSPGLDFETRLFYKPDAAALLERELSARSYQCKTILLGANTDPYQPIERQLRVTRAILEVLTQARHPVAITTKGVLVSRDIDLLRELARHDLVRVNISIPTLSDDTKRILEPRAASPAARLRIMRALADAGIPVGVMVAPIVPVITEHEIEAVLEASRDAGASWASYTLLRLPYEVKDLFREWLGVHFPERAEHVMSVVRALRGGRDNDPEFGSRMHGKGAFAELLRQRFALACRKLGLSRARELDLRTDLFVAPIERGGQLGLGF
jgi:DNA repair photolyase